MAVRSSDDFIALYSQIYFACHTRHVHDPESGTRVSARQASILSHLDSVEPTPLSQLASHMGVTVSTMSIAVDRLVRQGYVVRDRAESDGRVRHVRLTAAGERLRAAQKVLDARLVRAMLSRLSPADRRDALRGLELLGAAAREQTKERRSDQPTAPSAPLTVTNLVSHGARYALGARDHRPASLVVVLIVCVVGYVLPKSHVASVSARFAAPPDSIWTSLTDVAAFPQWRPGLSQRRAPA